MTRNSTLLYFLRKLPIIYENYIWYGINYKNLGGLLSSLLGLEMLSVYYNYSPSLSLPFVSTTSGGALYLAPPSSL